MENRIGSRKLALMREPKKLIMVILIGFLALVWLIPFVSIGVVNNDELMSHLGTVFKPLLYERNIEQGRIIQYYLSRLLGFIVRRSENFYVSRVQDFCFIMLSMCMLGILYYKLFRKFAFSCLTVCISLAMLPVTFEHTLPQAYCTFAFYFSLFLGTVLLFVRWFETEKKAFLVSSLVLNFYILFFYEAYIALMPLYVVVAWKFLPEESRNLKGLFHTIKYHILVGILYLAVYFSSRIFVPSTYEGNSVGTLTAGNTGQVIKQLLAASLPGYYWTNAKYRYIFREYSGYDVILSEEGVKSVLAANTDINMILFGILLFAVMVVLLSDVQRQKIQNSGLKCTCVVGIAFCFAILPLLPVAISKRYQAEVNASDFISVPAVYFSYLAVSFIVSYAIWELVARFGKKAIFAALIIIGALSMAIQLMNHVIENEQQENFFRVREIEKALSTNVVSQLEGMEVSAADLYEITNALAFENEVVEQGYWTLFAQHCGHHGIVLQNSTNESDVAMFYKDEKTGGLVSIRKNHAYYVLTDKKQSEPKAVKIDHERYVIAPFEQYSLDGGMYVYSYLIADDTLIPVTDTDMSVGNTWEETLKMTNIYDDGFIGRDGDFAIQMGDMGQLMISLYCPFELSGEEEYKIYINDQLVVSSSAENGQMEHVISTSIKNEMALVHIETNFSVMPDNGDERELSMLISNAYTE